MRESVLGLAFLVSVAAWSGVEAPVASGLLALAGAVVGEDLREGERTLGSLGLADLTREQLTAALAGGNR